MLVTGPTASGKSSTLAVLLDHINSEHCYHIITVEDPIEFLHNHKKSTIHQRELHSDTPNFALALRAALRQAPKVILVGEMPDREIMEIVLEAAETGHLVLSTLNTVDASKTVDRIVGSFSAAEQQGNQVADMRKDEDRCPAKPAQQRHPVAEQSRLPGWVAGRAAEVATGAAWARKPWPQRALAKPPR